MSLVTSARINNPSVHLDSPRFDRFRGQADFFRFVVFVFGREMVGHFGISACLPIADQLTTYHLFTRVQDPSPRAFRNGGQDTVVRTGSQALPLTHYSGFAARQQNYVAIAGAVDKLILLDHLSGIYARKLRIGRDFGSERSRLFSDIESQLSTCLLALVCAPDTK